MIKTREVMLIGADGTSMGITPLAKAKDMAREYNLDLVEVSPNANPPVCKILDYGKYKYKLNKKAQEAKKKQKVIHIKEVKMTPNIDEHDYQFKLNHIKRFIEDGNKAKVTVIFKGRGVLYTHLGAKMLDRIADDTKELAVIDQGQTQEGRTLTMTLISKNTKNTK